MDEHTFETESNRAGQVAERLRRLQQLGVRRGRGGLVTPPSHEEAPPRSPKPDEASAGAGPRRGIHAGGLLELVGGREVDTPFGPCVVAETRFSLAGADGRPGDAALAITGAAVAACSRDSRLAQFDVRRAAFLDTETSGLAGGAGTYAFMVGIGVFEDAGSGEGESHAGNGSPRFTSHETPSPWPDPDEDNRQRQAPAFSHAYVVRQVFMRNPSEERALLHVTEQLLARCTGLVSFNGRAFDAPLLRTRFLMHREPSALDDLLHLDLLPAARQRWRLRLPSCAMGALERDILGFQRSQEDVPGWLIPSIYQEFARGGDGPAAQQAVEDMARVFYHNREDIVSMVPLAGMLCAPFEDAQRSLILDGLHPVDSVSLARCYEELGWLEAGEHAYRQALARLLPQEVRTMALSRLGWLLKRQERRDEAAAVWRDWITSVPGPDPTPYEELAKHHEWVEVDLEAARKWTLWGFHTARQMPPSPVREQALASLQHRLERLERKLADRTR